MLYGREAYIADELQRTMLPGLAARSPPASGSPAATCPAAETARVGGDWYDAIPLPGSRVALVVGDVMGHSMTSAAIMGQLRTTAQTLAGLDLPPQEVLHHLDEQAQRLGSDRMATCLYAVYDPVAHRIVDRQRRPSAAGAAARRTAAPRCCGCRRARPIGVGGVDFEAVELDAPAGATLLLYTDGLVESRAARRVDRHRAAARAAAATARLTGPVHPPPLEPLCDEVLDIARPGRPGRRHRAARRPLRRDRAERRRVLVPGAARTQTPGRARRLARRALRRWGLEELADSVGAAGQRGGDQRRAVRRAARSRCGCCAPTCCAARSATTCRSCRGCGRRGRTDEGGRGLYLVNRLARRWGATRLSAGKVVWFEMGIPDRGGR